MIAADGQAEDFAHGEPAPEVRQAQALIRWCDHMVIVHPLWLGGPPALLKAFLEQVFRYGFALSSPGSKVASMTSRVWSYLVRMA